MPIWFAIEARRPGSIEAAPGAIGRREWEAAAGTESRAHPEPRLAGVTDRLSQDVAARGECDVAAGVPDLSTVRGVMPAAGHVVLLGNSKGREGAAGLQVDCEKQTFVLCDICYEMRCEKVENLHMTEADEGIDVSPALLRSALQSAFSDGSGTAQHHGLWASDSTHPQLRQSLSNGVVPGASCP
ncbi:unnamed protein product [Effrenium voratum]|uniref:Uncharacterized protein n=1 Tax=Effrenium voratum TaxID=2562239 RepID=A0AA36HL38_9DINO|nr:unnamed protein product [Effrenium voratum]